MNNRISSANERQMAWVWVAVFHIVLLATNCESAWNREGSTKGKSNREVAAWKHSDCRKRLEWTTQTIAVRQPWWTIFRNVVVKSVSVSIVWYKF